MGSVVSITLSRRRSLAPGTFELSFTRPPGFSFKPGQKITLHAAQVHRDYTLLNAPQDRTLSICVRRVPDGRLTPLLEHAAAGHRFQVTPPFGHFLYQSSGRQPVFIATGTGIAPFVSFARSGVRGFHLLHGVRTEKQLYYRDELQSAANLYVPCLSGAVSTDNDDLRSHAGRVTEYIENHLDQDSCDFYLCGRRDMIRDVTRMIDRKFRDARVFTEIFY